jgi:hypothetical protein
MAEELRRFIASAITYRSDLNLSACLFYSVVSKQIVTTLLWPIVIVMFNNWHNWHNWPQLSERN